VVFHVVGVRLLLGQFDLERHYLSSDWVQISSGGSVACTSQSSDYTRASSDFADNSGGHFTFQVNAVGVRVGKAIAGVVEVGIGYKGILNLGFSYQF